MSRSTIHARGYLLLLRSNVPPLIRSPTDEGSPAGTWLGSRLSDRSGFYHVEFDQSVHLDGVFHG